MLASSVMNHTAKSSVSQRVDLKPFGGRMTLSQGSPKTLETAYIYLMIHKSNKITTFMREQ